MTKTDVSRQLSESLELFKDEVQSALDTSSFSDEQRIDLEHLMKQVFYTLNEFKGVIENLKK